MAAAFVDKALKDKVAGSKILMVGAGGIGCELLKNLVLTGFVNIEMIDLDTIDVSNLNRQFLFRREHVGKSKSQVAKESALKFNPKAKIKAYHDTIISQDYDANFYKQFDMVMNALDNTAARNHVNKMCLAANVPLIESGTAGYLGQVTVIKKGETECYECQPKPRQKSFPGCTIRNTPSEPIHCIVWAKHLFNQLYGEDDPDQDVSPDGEDPELMADAGKSALEKEAVNNDDAVGGILRRSTRDWAHSVNYDAMKIFTKLFCNDIKYLLSMDTLWKSRRPPTPLDWHELPTEVSGDSPNQSEMKDQRVESVESYANMFKDSLATLRDELSKHGSEGILVWDKDDDPAMDFVTAAANIRAHIFGIPLKSRFDIKSMAGNIIPAIATTNAVVAALIVMESLKILQGRLADCKTVYLTKKPNPRKRILVPCTLMKPNPKCLACCEKPEVAVKLNTATTTVKTLEDKILKSKLGMAAPDVEIDDDKGSILISSEEGETEQNSDKFLSNFGIRNGSRLVCDDFLQCYNLVVNIIHADKLEDDEEFEIIGDMSQLHAKPEEEPSTSNNGGNAENEDNDLIEIVEEEEINAAPKRKRSMDGESATSVKKRKTSMSVEVEDDVCIVLD